MIQRELIRKVRTLASKMPVISITGPRQSGKTTLTKLCFPKYDYINLENPSARERAENDPEKFLRSYKKGIIIDEAQLVPKLFSYVQVIADESNKKGRFILTGSQNFLLLEKITQSLAGRVAVLHLLPFSIKELSATKFKKNIYEDYLFKGFYPPVYDRKMHPEDFYSSYINTYIERDVRQIVNVRNLSTFQKFIQLCAGQAGQMLNSNAMATDIGVDHKTIRHWLSVLETSFIIFFLQPHHKNFRKRIVKTPKLYFYDTGLVSYLLGITSVDQLHTHYNRGALFENMVIADTMKNIYNAGKKPRLFYWRDNTGNEVDLIIDEGVTIKPVEIKSGRTINESFFSGLNYYNKLSKNSSENNYLIYGGNDEQKRSIAHILSWDKTIKLL